MITPRRTRLVRVPDLHAFQHAIAVHGCSSDVAEARSTAILVSTAAAGAELRHTLENVLLVGNVDVSPGDAAVVFPEILTRDGWYERLHHACEGAPRQLSAIEREVLMARAAREAIEGGDGPPFKVRAALVAEMLAFFDTMVRLGRTLDAFERLLVEELEPRVPIDRGAERLLKQTRFLVASFRRYRALVAGSGAADEHVLREHLVGQDALSPFRRVVVTVGDRSCGANGLWPADFDLLTRVPRLEQVEVIATENVLAAGLHERLQDLLPGFEEVEFGHPAALSGRVPTLAVPAGEQAPWWTSRDREEEMASIARSIKKRSAPGRAAPLDRVAIVCKRPLPYVYLAQSHLAAAGIPFQAFDDLPLAAEPYAAAVDLVFRFVESGFGAKPAIALLSSPHFAFKDDEGDVPVEAANALERFLRTTGSRAGADAFERLAESWRGPESKTSERLAARAAAAIARAARELAGPRGGSGGASSAPSEGEGLARAGLPLASAQFDILLGFLERHSRVDVASTRAARARGAILGALRQLLVAHLTHDDPPMAFDEFVSRIRRWMEGQTFAPRTGDRGVHLVDADSARYGDFDEAHLVGLIEREWPDKSGRSIFYPLALLNHVGWPPERLRLVAARAAFKDLVRLPGGRVSVSAFLLEDDAIVEPSPFLDELAHCGLAVSAEDPPRNLRILAEEALSIEPMRADVLGGDARAWADLRCSRGSFSRGEYHGWVGPVRVRAHAVRRIETYLDCPFKYLSESVLGLEDEADDDPTEGPRAQGKLLHDILNAFFEAWQASGRGAVTGENIEDARTMLAALVDAKLASLTEAEASLWRTRLLGSPVRAGIGEAVFRAEASAAAPVLERLLEWRFDGSCRLEGADGSRDISLRGIADRIDVLDGNRLRIIDYKLGRAPDVRRAVQLPIYAVQAVQQLASRGRHVAVADAAYVAFGERDPYVRLAARGSSVEQAVAAGQQRALEAIDGIARGAFAARPAVGLLCSYCAYAAVCRKDFVDVE